MKKGLLILVGLLLASTSFAGNQQGQDNELERIKLGCTNPAAVGNQIRPSKIQISCNDERVVWEEAKPGRQYVDSKRVVSTMMRTNKTNLGVDMRRYDVPMEQTGVDCPVMVEVRKVATFNYAVTCDEINQMNSMLEFCVERLEKDIQENMDLLTVEATGNRQDSCQGPIQQRRQQK